jgi:succinate-semialdehyde dehydrogenase/glutarate-semialdehyde dehydrogenase
MSATFDVMSPATGQPVASIPDNGVEDARAAAARAVAAFPTWRRTTAYERSAVMRRRPSSPRRRRSAA